jgi:heme/copper-type cytochrome/quinol oxidase subunit 2
LCIKDLWFHLFCYDINMSPQQQASQEAAQFVTRVNDVILFPLIALLSGIAFIFFLYGCAQYIMNASSDQAREEGKKHIMYGLIGLVVMMSAFAILTLAVNTFGLGTQLNCADNPSASGCGSAFKLAP